MYDTRRQRLRDLSCGAAPHIPQPEGIALPLMPHQLAAVEYARTTRRMVIADRMGTGRDISAIAALAGTNGGPFLVATPPSLVRQWHEDLEKVLPNHRVRDFSRSGEITERSLGAADAVIVRHRQFARSADTIAAVGFGGMVFDQCQALACRWTQLATAARHVIGRLPVESSVVVSSPLVLHTPRSLAGAVEAIGALERHPSLAAVSGRGTWSGVQRAVEIVDELRGDCLLARGHEAVMALIAQRGAIPCS